MRTLIRIWKIEAILILSGVVSTAFAQSGSDPSKEEVLDAIRKSSSFMANTVSYHGGYLWKYSEDFSEREGEAPARETQIMCQGGTPRMGHMFLDLYNLTGDKTYLSYAKNVADALIYGQHPLGGWHYFIDFNRKDIESYYRDTSSRFASGMEEYRHYYGNCTYDDGATQEPTAYLLRLYMKTLSPEYLAPLKKALNFMLISQYPNGGWPQRYPLRYEAVHEGLPDYTSNYTLNDNAMSNTIDVLLEAYEKLGDERYLEAARRGGDFFIISQGPEGHEGWAEQYDMNIQPAWARTHEPPGFMPRQTIVTISTLEKLFLVTGDRRYLKPIPDAIDWLKKSRLQVNPDGRSEFSRIYDPETNLPVNRRDVIDPKGEKYTLHKFFTDDSKPFLGERTWHNLDEVIAQYEKVKNVKEGEEKQLCNELFSDKRRSSRKPSGREIREIISSMNDDGAWIEDIQIWNIKEPGKLIYGGKANGRKTIRGIDVQTYLNNMQTMTAYIR